MTKQREENKMREYRVEYYVSDKDVIDGIKPHSGISDCEITEAENEEEAIYNIVYYLMEQAAEVDEVKYAEIEDKIVRFFNHDDECFEEYEVFKAEPVEA